MDGDTIEFVLVGVLCGRAHTSDWVDGDPFGSSLVFGLDCARILIESTRFPPFGFGITGIGFNSNGTMSFF